MKHFILTILMMVMVASGNAGIVPTWPGGSEAISFSIVDNPFVVSFDSTVLAVEPITLPGTVDTPLLALNAAPPEGGYVYDPYGLDCTRETIDLTGIFLLIGLEIPNADSGGPYIVGPDSPAMFNHLGSTVPEGYEFRGVQWNVGGTSFSCDYDIEIPIPYEILTDDLGLTNGIYDLKLELTLYHSEDDSDITVIDLTTLEIVPEPCSLLIFGAGSLLVGLRRRGK